MKHNDVETEVKKANECFDKNYSHLTLHDRDAFTLGWIKKCYEQMYNDLPDGKKSIPETVVTN